MLDVKDVKEEISEPVSESVKQFDLQAEIIQLEMRKPWPQGITSKLLLKTSDLRILLVAMRSGASMAEHHNDGRISIHTLRGAINVRVGKQERILRSGHMITLDRGIKHDVEANEDSVFLLTSAWLTDEELSGIEHRGYGS